MKWQQGEACGDTKDACAVTAMGTGCRQMCGGRKDRLLKHPPCFPGQFVQPMLSFCDFRSNKGWAGTALLWREVRAHKVLRTGAADQSSPPHKSVSSYCPQGLSTWMGLLCSRGRDAEGSESHLFFTCQLCQKLLQGNWAEKNWEEKTSFTILVLADPGCIFFEFQLLHLFCKKLRLSYSAQHKRSEFIHFIFVVNWTTPHRRRQDTPATMDGEKGWLLLLSEKKKFFKHHCNEHPKKVSIFRPSLQQQFIFKKGKKIFQLLVMCLKGEKIILSGEKSKFQAG